MERLVSRQAVCTSDSTCGHGSTADDRCGQGTSMYRQAQGRPGVDDDRQPKAAVARRQGRNGNMERQRIATWNTNVPLLALVLCAGMAVLNLVHPLLHPFEGGTLDALLSQGNLWALAWLDFSRGMAGD